MSAFCVIDDKYVPLSRILWIAATPHFCGDEACQREGQYEVRLECDETLWATHAERDSALTAIQGWLDGDPSDSENEE